jgi:type IV fimbrial biogenesis protein FimT
MSSIGRGRGSSAGRAGIPRGFTLVELMVAIMVLAILFGLAVPSFRDASLGSRLAGYANDMVASSQLARSEAVKRNRLVVICATDTTSDGDFVCVDEPNWETGWAVGFLEDVDRFDEDGDPITVTVVNVIQQQPALTPEFRFTLTAGGGADSVIVFPPTVAGVTPATFRVCRFNPVGKQERQVRITATGTAAVTTPPAAGSCPSG